MAILIWLLGCQHQEVNRQGEVKKSAKKETKPATSVGRSQSDKPYDPIFGGTVSLSPLYDGELRKIISLAGRNEWEEAEARASALYAMDPKDSAVQRVYQWIKTEGPKRREKILEDKIRDVSSQESRFNPTIKSLLTDKKSNGLPPRSDLREAIEKLKAEPYIPETYGKRIQNKGSLEGLGVKAGRMSELLSREVEVQLDNVTLDQIVFNLGQAQGINFIADKSLPAFQQRLSVNVKGAKLSEVMKYIERNMNLQFQVGEDLVWIIDGKDTNKVMQETRFYRLKRGLIRPAQFGISDATKTSVTANNVTTVTETQKFENFVRDGAAPDTAIELAVKNFFTGKYQIDYERNVVVARGTPDQLELVDRIVEEFDRPMQQVLIEARFITVTESAFLNLGMIWETGRSATSGQIAEDFTGLAPGIVSRGIQETWWNILGSSNLSATLSALDQSGESETLSAPRVTLINNLPATISDGKIQYYYEEYQVQQKILQYTSTSSLVPLGKPTKINAGVSLDVIASIGGDGKSIMLALRPRVTQDVRMVTFATINDFNADGKVVSSQDIKLPEAREQMLATRLVVKSGQTVVMGGVNQREQKTFVESVPVLGNLPLIGAAFRRRTELDNPRYLLIFVTATIVSENGEYIVSSEAE